MLQKYFTLILLSLVLSLPATAQRKIMDKFDHPFVIGGNMVDFGFQPDGYGWYLSRGQVVYTEDAGANWQSLSPLDFGVFLAQLQAFSWTPNKKMTGFFNLNALLSPTDHPFFFRQQTQDKGQTRITDSLEITGFNSLGIPLEVEVLDEHFSYGYLTGTDTAGNGRPYCFVWNADQGRITDVGLQFPIHSVNEMVFSDSTHGLLNITTPPPFTDKTYQTTDGGKSWTEIGNRNPPLYMVDDQKWISAEGITTDAGQSWQAFSYPAPYAGNLFSIYEPASISFLDTENGVVSISSKSTGRYDVLRTTDGGQSWIRDSIAAALNPLNWPITQLQMLSPDIIFAKFKSENIISTVRAPFTLLNTSLAKNELAALKLYPNPVKVGQALQLELPPAVSRAEVQLMNISGQQLYRQTISASQASLQLPPLARGIYLLKLTSKAGITSHKLWIR